MSRLRVNKLGIFSVAKIYGVMGLAMGLLIGIPYGLMIIVFSLGAAGSAGGEGAFALGGMGLVGGIVAMILLPLMYGVFGFIGGIIGALLYNIFAGIVGGVEIEVENVA